DPVATAPGADSVTCVAHSAHGWLRQVGPSYIPANKYCDIVTAKIRSAAANPGSAGRTASHSTSARPSERPSGGLSARTHARARRALPRAHPGRYKSKRYCEGTHDARLRALTILRARSALLPVCPTSPTHSQATRASGNWRPRVLSLYVLRRRLRGTFLSRYKRPPPTYERTKVWDRARWF